MKTMNKTFGWMLAAVLSLALVSSADAQDKQRTGKVVRIKGEARYSTGNKVWLPLKVGTVLKSGYTVQTAQNSFVDVVLNEENTAQAVDLAPLVAATSASSSRPGAGGGGGSSVPTPDQDVVRILDDSYLIFDSLSATATGADTVTETMLDLKKGSVFGTVKKQAAASRFEVKTPNGVAGIRGTIFLINANGNIACLVGSVIVAFTDASGNVVTQIIAAGQQFIAATRQVTPLSAELANFLQGLLAQTNYRGGGRGPIGRGPVGGVDHGLDQVSRHVPGHPLLN